MHQYVGIVERYYAPLHWVYKIISDKLKETGITKGIALQIIIKTVNSTADTNEIVLSFFLFGA